jgi:two-component system OmpR family response regulator
MRVLIVEDETRLADALRRGLTADGFVVDVVGNGADGLWTARNGAYDVIVLDIMLPRLNGYDVCKELRRLEIWTPVLMLTAKDGEWDEVDAFDIGADDYLVKPFSFVVLKARLRALIRRVAPARPVELAVGDLVLNPATRRVTRGTAQITLTPREFGLLQYLMRQAGEVVSKVDILDNVWDSQYEGDDNVVEVYIRYLRKKIDLPFDRQSIETVRGAGYRIVDDGA